MGESTKDCLEFYYNVKLTLPFVVRATCSFFWGESETKRIEKKLTKTAGKKKLKAFFGKK